MEKEAKLHGISQRITAAVSHVSRCVCVVNCCSRERYVFVVTCYEYTAYDNNVV